MGHFVAPDGWADRYRDCYVPPDLQGREGDWKAELPDYYGMCASLDVNLGRLLKELARLGELDNTVIAFLSDHGCTFRSRTQEIPRSEYKRTCHESSIRIPLVLSGPCLQVGRTVPELVSLVDVPPTLLRACGLAVPSQMQGSDLLPLVRGQAKDWPDEVFIQISESHDGRALRTRRWKYAVAAVAGQANTFVETFLYDLQQDPCEKTNLIGDPRCRPVAEELRPRLVARMLQAGESQPTILPPG